MVSLESQQNIDINLTDIGVWDDKTFTGHRVASRLREIIQKELTDPRYSINVNY